MSHTLGGVGESLDEKFVSGRGECVLVSQEASLCSTRKKSMFSLIFFCIFSFFFCIFSLSNQTKPCALFHSWKTDERDAWCLVCYGIVPWAPSLCPKSLDPRYQGVRQHTLK